MTVEEAEYGEIEKKVERRWWDRSEVMREMDF